MLKLLNSFASTIDDEQVSDVLNNVPCYLNISLDIKQRFDLEVTDFIRNLLYELKLSSKDMTSTISRLYSRMSVDILHGFNRDDLIPYRNRLHEQGISAKIEIFNKN